MNATDAADLIREEVVVLVNKLPQFEYEPKQCFRGWQRTKWKTTPV